MRKRDRSELSATVASIPAVPYMVNPNPIALPPVPLLYPRVKSIRPAMNSAASHWNGSQPTVRCRRCPNQIGPNRQYCLLQCVLQHCPKDLNLLFGVWQAASIDILGRRETEISNPRYGNDQRQNRKKRPSQSPGKPRTWLVRRKRSSESKAGHRKDPPKPKPPPE